MAGLRRESCSGHGGRLAGLQGIVQDRVQQVSSRSLIFPVEVFKVFAQVRVHPLLCTFQLVFMKSWMSLVKVFSALFPNLKKVRRPQPT